jgi:6-pyruvoyltetrahydropterin/6-carboxytetrahydropterin synthase
MSRTVRLTRVVQFSAGHRFWRPGLTAEENLAHFGPYASPEYHGHNYVLRATCSGQVQPNGMVVNIKEIDDLLDERIVDRLDRRSLNGAFPDLPAPTLEALLPELATCLRPLPDGVVLERLQLAETDWLWADWTPDMTTLTRSYEFAASHRLHVADMTDEENFALFGKCSWPHGHGHNYVLEVTVEGTPDPATGMMLDLSVLDAVVLAEVVERYDHRNLNLDVPELAGKNPTTETVACAIFDQLAGKVPGRLARVKVWETARSSFEVSA